MFSEPVAGFDAARRDRGRHRGRRRRDRSRRPDDLHHLRAGHDRLRHGHGHDPGQRRHRHRRQRSTASTSTDNTVTYVPGDPNPGVNDPPVLTATPLSAELGLPTVFTGGSVISVVDPDAFGSDVQVTITVTDGTVVVPSGGAATVTGAGTASVTITGPMSVVNSTLSTIGVIFTEVGSKPIDVTADRPRTFACPGLDRQRDDHRHRRGHESAGDHRAVRDRDATTDPGQPGALRDLPRDRDRPRQPTASAGIWSRRRRRHWPAHRRQGRSSRSGRRR